MMRWMWICGVVAMVLVSVGCDSAQPETSTASDSSEADSTSPEDSSAAADTTHPPPDVPEDTTPLSTTACNGADVLCARRFNDVAYATTHNAMSSVENGWLAANHYKGVVKQLEAGVRGLMLDAHPYLSDSYLCHGECLAGNQLLVEGLEEIAVFLEAHPREVITLIFESYITATAMKDAFEKSGLIDYVYEHDLSIGWPTLGEMIDGGERLVVLTDSEGGAYPWYHEVWALSVETNWSNSQLSDLSCDKNRGAAGNPLFILNHFMSDPLPRPALAEQINHNPFFIDRAHECEAAFGQIPNFVTVDFYTVGSLFEVVAALNEL